MCGIEVTLSLWIRCSESDRSGVSLLHLICQELCFPISLIQLLVVGIRGNNNLQSFHYVLFLSPQSSALVLSTVRFYSTSKYLGLLLSSPIWLSMYPFILWSSFICCWKVTSFPFELQSISGKSNLCEEEWTCSSATHVHACVCAHTYTPHLIGP